MTDHKKDTHYVALVSYDMNVLFQGQLEKGQLKYRRKGNLVATRRMDKKDVYTLSSIHRPVLQLSQGRWEVKYKPKAVVS